MQEKPEARPERRARLVSINFEDLPKIFRGEFRVGAIPKTAYIQAVHVNYLLNAFDIIVVDASFEAIEPGNQMKRFMPDLEPIRKPRAKKS